MMSSQSTAVPAREQQLVARIKRSSKYFGQTAPNEWFDVEVAENTYYQISGNNNNYDVVDVVLGMRLSTGAVLDFGSGKKVAAAKGGAT